MSKKQGKRSVKSVGGYKVNHPHSFANMFYGLLVLIIVGVPFGILYTPLAISTGISEFTITGWDLFNFIKNGFKVGEDAQVFLRLQGLAGEGSMLSQAVTYLTFAQAFLLIFFALISVICFFYFVVIVCKGYVRSSKVIRNIVSMNALFVSLFSLSFVSYYAIMFIEKINDSQLFPWYALVPAGGTILISMLMNMVYSSAFRNAIQESDIEYDENESATNDGSPKIIEEPLGYSSNSHLPLGLTEIVDSQFSKNQNLIVANIPSVVPRLGNSAFANCLKLQVVNIPKSVKEIGYNCFFNCASLQRINYAGTKDEWNNISRGSNWLSKAGTDQVICSDGAISVNPLH